MHLCVHWSGFRAVLQKRVASDFFIMIHCNFLSNKAQAIMLVTQRDIKQYFIFHRCVMCACMNHYISPPPPPQTITWKWSIIVIAKWAKNSYLWVPSLEFHLHFQKEGTSGYKDDKYWWSSINTFGFRHMYGWNMQSAREIKTYFVVFLCPEGFQRHYFLCYSPAKKEKKTGSG